MPQTELNTLLISLVGVVLAAVLAFLAKWYWDSKAAVAALAAARDAKAAEAEKAKRDAATQTLAFKGRTAAILAQVAGVDWCKTWGAMVTDYTVMRHVK